MSKRRCGTCDATGIGFDGANCFDCGGSGYLLPCEFCARLREAIRGIADDLWREGGRYDGHYLRSYVDRLRDLTEGEP